MINEQQLPPLIVSDELINERGIMVFDNIHQMLIYGEPYIAPYITISMCVQGWVDAEYDMRPVRFEAGDIAVVHAKHTVCVYRSSDDYHAIQLSISPQIEEELKGLLPSVYIDFYHYIWQPAFHLTKDQQTNMIHAMQLLKNISFSKMPERELLLKGMLHLMAVLLRNYRIENGHVDHFMSPRQELFMRFHQAIVEHFRESREVRFYADLLCLTPKHFATIIKQQTGINALQWINNYVIIQAKTLLRNRCQLTIQQITHQLGFSDQAAFSRYFKTHTGLSPSEFRARN